MANLANDPIFNDETAARAHLEALRWPNGPVCPHCGGHGDDVSAVQKTDKRRKPTPEGKRHKPARLGRYYCKSCTETFTVTVGTVMEDSHVPIHKWLYAFRQLCASKKGMSAHQLHRSIGVSYKTAWFMAHRIREAMRSGGLAPPMGGGGQIIEADETFIGRKKGVPKFKGGFPHKCAVLTLVNREGEARSFHLEDNRARNIVPIVKANIAREARLATDEAGVYKKRPHFRAA
jgi:transposase-like protein